MSAPRWREEAISRNHDRAALDRGTPELNEYLRLYARQNHESGGAKTFVAAQPDVPARILGYYSISPASMEFSRVPAALSRKLGRYEVPVYRLGRLAVSVPFQGQGIGSALLFAAGRRALSVATEVGGVAPAIDAKDERSAQWCERFGALPLLDDPLRLVLPPSTIRDVLAGDKSRGTQACGNHVTGPAMFWRPFRQ
jgi:GNAT superfamily N-acetyltransferase